MPVGQQRVGATDDLLRRVGILETTPVGYTSVLSDTTDLVAWYKADNLSNVDSGSPPKSMTSLADLGTNGGTIAPTPLSKWSNILNQKPFWDFGAGGATASLTLPLKGALTFFGVLKPITNGTFQNLYNAAALAALTAYWDNTGPRYQLGTTANSSNSPTGYGSWKTVTIAHFNSGSNPQAKLRENGVQLYSGAAGTVGTPIPGSGGSPTNQTVVLFKNGGSFPWASYLAEFGFYATDKSSTITSIEAYLREKYGHY